MSTLRYMKKGTGMESSNETEARALAWLAKRDSGRWSEADQAELAQWLSADTAHRVAFLRREAAWERTARLKAFGVSRKPGVVPPPGEWRTSPFFERAQPSAVRAVLKRPALKIAMAAAVLVVAAIGVYFSSIPGDAYSTPIGGYASIPLRDGSTVTLGTASRIRVDLTQMERHIELESGEAFFDVAKDPSRPFVVEAGSRRVVAVGTQFSVKRSGTDIQVVVTEGKVRVEPKAGAGRAEFLTAGAVAHTVQNSVLVQKKTPREAEEALSWRTGYLTFDGTALADVVAEFNRYTPQRIVIDDPQLAALRITGTFRASRAADFVELLKNGFGIEVRESEESIHLSSSGSRD